MTVRNFVPEIWSSRLLVALRKNLVYAQAGVINRNWEGDISDAGDTVRITSVGRPAIHDYVPNNTTITPEQLSTGQRTLTVNQAKYWAFEVDDVDARQAKSNLIPEAMSEAAYGLADVVDQFVASHYTGAQASNVAPAVTIDTATGTQAQWAKVYDNVLVPLKTKLDNADVPTAGRFAVLPPWMEGAFIRDERFMRVDASGSSEAMRNGMVRRAAGFDILLSNNVPVPTANVYAVIAGTNAAITFAEQISKTEAYRPESSFADAVKGLALYGAKLVRPDSLAYCLVTEDNS